MLELIISIVALLISAFGFYKLMGFEADSLIADCENLDIYDDLELKISELESAVISHVVNIRELEAKVSVLKSEVEGLSTSLNNVIEFADRTRGMVDEMQGNGRD